MSLVESVDHLPSTLAEREAVIERGLSSFLDVGNALIAIKRDRQYREAGYPTFEDYCAGRFQISRSRAYQLVAAAATTTTLVDALPELSTNVDTPLPRSEAQVRPLASLEPEQAAEAWVEAVEAAGGEQPTAAQVAEAVQIVTGAAPSVPTPAPVTPFSNVNPDTGEFLDDEEPDDEFDEDSDLGAALADLIDTPDARRLKLQEDVIKAVLSARRSLLIKYPPAEIAEAIDDAVIESIAGLLTDLGLYLTELRNAHPRTLRAIQGGRS